MEEHTVFGRGAGSGVHVPEKGGGWCEVSEEKEIHPTQEEAYESTQSQALLHTDEG